HSFHFFVPPILTELAKAAGFKDHQAVGLSAIGGSRGIQHWGRDAPGEDKNPKKALRAGKGDVLTLSPIHLPDEGIEQFAQLALEHTPKGRVSVEGFWPPSDVYTRAPPPKTGPADHTARTGDERRKRHEPYFKSIDEHVRELNKKLGKDVLFVVPVGQAVI